MENIGTGFRDPERIEPMLGKLREAWELYPDMRMGQLVAVCAGQGNIFGVEDNVLLKGIQRYINNFRGSFEVPEKQELDLL